MAGQYGDDTPQIPNYSWMSGVDDGDTSLIAPPPLSTGGENDPALQQALIQILNKTHPGKFDFIKAFKAAGQGTVFQFLYHTDDDQRIVAVVKVPDEQRCRQDATRLYEILEPVYNQGKSAKLSVEEVAARAVRYQKMRLIQEGRFYDECRILQAKGVLPRKLQRNEDMVLPFLALEFIDAPDYRRFLQTHTSLGSSLPDLHMVCRAVLAIALAVEAFHTAGFVHRDLKSGNVLIRTDPKHPQSPTAVLLDLGSTKKIVARWTGEHDLTSDAPAPATLHATPPEALSGFGLDEMSRETGMGEAELLKSFDLYSLGCLLYLGLTGQLPHTDEDPEDGLYKHLSEEQRMLERRRTGALTPIRRFRPNVPGDLASLTERLLATLPQDRPRMHTVIDVLREQIPELKTVGSIQDGEHTALGFDLKTKKKPVRAVDPEKGRRQKAILGIALLFLVLLGGLGWGVSQGLLTPRGPAISLPVAPTDFPEGEVVQLVLPEIQGVMPSEFVINNPSALAVVATGDPTEWKWEFGPEAQVTGKDSATPNVQFLSAGTFTAFVQVGNADGWSLRKAFKCTVKEDKSPPAIPTIANVVVPKFVLGKTQSISVTCTGQPKTFEWRLPAEALSPTNLSTVAPSMQFGRVGSFNGSVRVGNDIGWSEWKPFTCQVSAPPVIPESQVPIILSVSSPPGRVGTAIKATATASGNPTRWEWQYPIGPEITGTESSAMTIKFKTPGTYDGFVRAGNEHGWSKWKQFRFIATSEGDAPPPPSPPPVAGVKPTITRVTSTSFTCGDSTTISVVAEGPATMWEWQFDQSATVVNTDSASPSVRFNASGTFDASVRVGNQSGWSEPKRFKCIVGSCGDPLKVTAPSLEKVLVGGTITLTPTITGKPSSYAWDSGAGCTATESSSATFECTAQKAGAHTAKLTVRNEAGAETVASIPYVVLDSRIYDALAQTDLTHADGRPRTSIQFRVQGNPMQVRPGSAKLHDNGSRVSFIVDWAAAGSGQTTTSFAKRSYIISVSGSPVLSEIKLTNEADGSMLVEVQLQAAKAAVSYDLPGNTPLENKMVIVAE